MFALQRSVPALRVGPMARALSGPRLAMQADPGVAVAFDIDGVLIRGNEALPHAAESLARLDAGGVPWICVTNGGGVTEDVKAREVSSLIGYEIEPSQMVCCHTPFRAKVPEFGKKRVLILGCRDVVGVMRSYGFEDIVTVQEIAEDDPSRYPFMDWKHTPLQASLEERPVEAVFVVHDPVHWAPDVQITLDCLEAGPGGPAGKQTIPFFHANPDLVFAGRHSAPRLASGAFLEVISHMFHKVVGVPLQAELVGKPTKATFDFARYSLARRRDHVLAARGQESPEEASAHELHAMYGGEDAEVPPFRSIYMVGDNPTSDIRGANRAGGPWQSVLVRTGIFSQGDNDKNDPGQHVKAGIREAVDLVLQDAGVAEAEGSVRA